MTLAWVILQGAMMQRHTLSALFQDMDPAEFRDLVESVKKHGLREPITVFQGEILDGWHRYQACLETGVEPVFRELGEGENVVDFVVDYNLTRRHLNAGQRAMVAVQLRGETAKIADLAREARVSQRTVHTAKTIKDPDKVRDVITGAKALAVAANVADPKPAVNYKELYEKLKIEFDDARVNYELLAEEFEAVAAFAQDEGVARLKQLQAEVKILTQQRDHWQNEAASMKSMIEYWKRRAAA